MKKLFDDIFILVTFVLPFIFIYGKGLDYYRTTVVEPRVGMECSNGDDKVTWYYGDEIRTPTANCHTLEHYLEYNRWFVKKAPEVIASYGPEIEEYKAYFKEIMVSLTAMFYDIFNILIGSDDGKKTSDN